MSSSTSSNSHFSWISWQAVRPSSRTTTAALCSRLRHGVIPLILLGALGACGGDGGSFDPNAGAQAKGDGVGVPHTLGGTITGLGSTGLSLKNGTETLSPAPGATGFVFAAPIDDGATYAITITSQPGGFTRCSLSSNATGVIAAADVSNVVVTCAQTSAVVSTIAGGTSPGAANGVGTAASFYFPYGVATDAAGNIYVADAFNHQIRKIGLDGTVTTLAGNGSDGNVDGPAATARFSYPFAVATDSVGNVYVADWGNHAIRKLAPDGSVSTLAGNGTSGTADGTGNAASFSGPLGLAVDSAGTVFVADTNNNLIRKITSSGIVTTLAGSGSQGSTNGTGTVAEFRTPQGVTVDASGTVYVADTGNQQIRRITAAGVVTTLAGNGEAGIGNGAAATASFNSPTGVAIDNGGTLYVADSENHLIRRITADGQVSTLAGSGNAALTDGINAAASFNTPRSLVVGANGSLLIADGRNHSIRRIVSQ